MEGSQTAFAPAELLRKTRKLFAETHWGQGGLYMNDEKPRFCAVGGIRYWILGDPLLALDVAADPRVAVDLELRLESLDGEGVEHPDYFSAVEELARAAGVKEDSAEYDLDDDWGRAEYLEALEEKIYAWNDSAQRTLDDVLEAFDRAVLAATKE